MRFKEQVLQARRLQKAVDTADAPQKQHRHKTFVPPPLARAEPMRPLPTAAPSQIQDVLQQIFFDFSQKTLTSLLRRMAQGGKNGVASSVQTDCLRKTIQRALDQSDEATRLFYETRDAIKIEFDLDEPDDETLVESTVARWQSSEQGMRRLEILLQHYKQAQRIAVVTWDTKRTLFLLVLAKSHVMRDYVFGEHNDERESDGFAPVRNPMATTIARHLALMADQYVTQTHVSQHEMVEHIALQYTMNMPNVHLPIFYHSGTHS
jgi:hypothetical protein